MISYVFVLVVPMRTVTTAKNGFLMSKSGFDYSGFLQENASIF
jgi:hypothetical protein